MTNEQLEAIAAKIKEFEDFIKSDPEYLMFLKNIVWTSIQGCTKLKYKNMVDMVRRTHSDDFVDCELGLKSPDDILNPWK